MAAEEISALLGQSATDLDFPFCCFNAESLRIRDVNQGMSLALGYSADALREMSFRELLRPDAAKEFRVALEGLGDGFTNLEHWQIIRRSG